MQIKELIKLSRRLNVLCEMLDEAYWINSGGCCYVCTIIASALDRLKIHYKLVLCINPFEFYEKEKYSALAIRKSMKNRDLPSFDHIHHEVNHYAIYISDINEYINLNPYTKHYYNKFMVGCVNSNDISWIYDTGKWNEEYDIINNCFVEESFDNIFREYEK